jgi:TonB-linked SusC/RagA family outer membrane protein
MKKKLTTSLLGVFSLLLMSFATLAQNYTIKGKIADSDGQPMVGATVVLKGTTFGTAANANGEYSFNAKTAAGNYDLEFRSVGYANATKKITLGSATELNVNVAMTEDGMSLDEVVVTGSTIKTSRRTLGNAISTVSAKDIQSAGTGNLFGALQGKIPGAQITQNSGDPAGGISIRIRGTKSLSGSSDPLYVIDGVVVSNNSSNVAQLALDGQASNNANLGTNRMADINPNDIENISVLPGAAAAAIYGSRANNGVVVITTKRGKSGAPKITFSTSVSSNELRKKVYISTYGKQFGFVGYRLGPISGASDAGLPAFLAANPGVTTTRIVRDGTGLNMPNNLVDVTRYDYQDQIYRTGTGTDNYLSVTGGSEKTQYSASLSYTKNNGIINGTDFQRYGAKVRIDQFLNKWAKLSAGLAYNNSFSNEKPNGNVFYSPINSINITSNIYDITQRDASGNLLAVEPTRVNPLSTIESMFFSSNTNRTIADVQLNLTPLKGLSVDAVFGVDSYSQFGKNYISPYAYQSVAGLPLERYPAGYAAVTNNNVSQYNADLNVTYNRDLTKDINLNFIVGMNNQYYQNDVATSTGQSLAPFITTVSGAASTTVTGSNGLDRYSINGQFAQATFGYQNKAFITAAVRRDGSTIFSPSQTNQIYPKISGSYVALEGQSGMLNSAKLRASYGESGGITAIPTYGRFYQFSSAAYLGKNTFLPNTTLANPNVKPERMKEVEFGADFGLLNNRINLGLSYYKQDISDLTVNKVLASSSGGTSIVDNVGAMQNSGFEVALGGTVVKQKDFSWDLGITYSRNRNLITKLPGGNVTVANDAGAPIVLVEGQPSSVFFGNPYARNPDGSYLLTPQGFPQRERGQQGGIDAPATFTPLRGADGQPTGAFINSVIGNPNPDWIGSLNSSLNYKGVNLRFLLDAVQGQSVFNADRRTRQGVGIGDFAEKEMKGELPRGYIYSIYTIQEWRIDDGSYVKLREISLGYTFKNLLSKGGNLAVNLLGRNLISWDKYDGYDPETNAGGNSNLYRGVDFGNVPIPRTYKLTVTATF